jgi:hypothetical protein
MIDIRLTRLAGLSFVGFLGKIVSANNLGDLLWSEVPVKVFSKGVYG